MPISPPVKAWGSPPGPWQELRVYITSGKKSANGKLLAAFDPLSAF
jgi:hypothetical protein